MIRYFLNRVRIEGFRGINNSGAPLDLRFDPNSVNSIWAPNAFGKSSIYEALSYAIRGTVPRLDALEATERPSDYISNVFHGGDATIELTLSPDDGGADVTVRVVRSRAGARTVTSPSGHADPEAVLESLRHDHTLLDYATFGRFILDSALSRGRSFASLLGMAHLSDVRRAIQQLSNTGNLDRDFGIPALRLAIQNAERQQQQSVSTIRTAHHGLLGLPPTEPMDTDAIVAAATHALGAVALFTNALDGCTILDVSFEDLTEAIRNAERSEDQAALTEHMSRIRRLETLAPDDRESSELVDLAQLASRRDEALARTRGPVFQRLFTAVSDVLESGEWERREVCPACESTPDTAPEEFVARQLAAFEAATQAGQQMHMTWSGGLASRRLRELEASADLSVPDEDRLYATASASFAAHGASQDLIRAIRARLEALEGMRLAALDTASRERDRLRSELPASLVALTEQVTFARQLRDAVVAYRATNDPRGALMRSRRKLLRRLEWSRFITEAALAFERAETSFSRSQTQALRSAYQAMYATVTGGTEVIPLLKKGSQTERVELRLNRFFDRTDLSARALLSESYRNAMGIAVFLSAALSRQVPARFMVLDDVTSSFDAGHQWHLMELLRTQVALPLNPTGLQLIVLSHDGMLEKYFDRLSGEPGWRHMRLHGRAATGRILTDPQESNRLRADAERFLDAGQVRQAEPLVRQYLEMSLQRIITKLRIPVPIDFVIRNDRQMVQNCLDAIRTAVDLQQRAGALILDPTQVSDLTRTHMPAIVANWVAHYGTGAATSLAPAALRGVLDSIDRLSVCFQYPDPVSGNHRFYAALDRR